MSGVLERRRVERGEGWEKEGCSMLPLASLPHLLNKTIGNRPHLLSSRHTLNLPQQQSLLLAIIAG